MSRTIALFAAGILFLGLLAVGEDKPKPDPKSDAVKKAVSEAWKKSDDKSYVYACEMTVKAEGAAPRVMKSENQHKKGWWKAETGKDIDGNSFSMFSDGKASMTHHKGEGLDEYRLCDVNDLAFGPTDAVRVLKLLSSASWGADEKVGGKDCRVAKATAAVAAVKELADGSGWNPANVIKSATADTWIDKKDGVVARTRITIEQDVAKEGGGSSPRTLVVDFTLDYAAKVDFEVPKKIEELIAWFGKADKDVAKVVLDATKKLDDAPHTFKSSHGSEVIGLPGDSWEVTGTHKKPWTRIELKDPPFTAITDGKGCVSRESDGAWKKDERISLSTATNPDFVAKIVKSARWGGYTEIDGVACHFAWAVPDLPTMAKIFKDCGLNEKSKVADGQVTFYLDKDGHLRRLKYYVMTSTRHDQDGSADLDFDFTEDPKADPAPPKEVTDLLK